MRNTWHLFAVLSLLFAVPAYCLPKGAKLLEKHASVTHGEVGVYELNGLRVLYTLGNGHLVSESAMSIASPSSLSTSYLMVMGLVAAVQSEARTIFDWSLGGGSLPRFFMARHPHIRVTSAEIDLELLSLAKKYFHLESANHEILGVDAIEWLRATNRRFDVIWQDSWLPIPQPSGGKRGELSVLVDLFTNIYPKVLKPNGVAAMWCGVLPLKQINALAATAKSRFKRVLVLEPRHRRSHYVLAVGNHPQLTCKEIQRLHKKWQTQGWATAPVDTEHETFCRQVK